MRPNSSTYNASRAIDLLLDTVQIEDRPRGRVQFDARRAVRNEIAREAL